MAILRRISLRKTLMVSVAVGTLLVHGPKIADAAMAVFDAANIAEALKQLAEMQNMVSVLKNVRDYQSYLRNLAGSLSDDAVGFVDAINTHRSGMQAYLFAPQDTLSQYNLNLGNVGEAMNFVDDKLMARPGSGGLSDARVQTVIRERDDAIFQAARRGYAVALHVLSDQSSSTRIGQTAAYAQSVRSTTGQQHATNRLLVELLTAMERHDKIAAAALELQTAQALRQQPIAVGVDVTRVSGP